MKIQTINSYNMRNDEHFQFHTEFRTLVYDKDPAVLKITPLFNSYLALYDNEDTALKKIMKSAITADIQEADKQRDIIFAGMIDAQKAALKHFNTTIQSAAKRLQVVFDTYGNLAKKPLNEQTSSVYNLLQDLNGKYAVDTETVGLHTWATELERLNDIFSALVKDRYDESALRTDIILKEARLKLDELYRTIAERINALVIVEGPTVYTDFIKMLNVIITKYNNIMAQRAGKKKGGKSKEEEE